MEYSYQESYKLKDFFSENSGYFEKTLLDEAENVRNKIDEILTIGNIDLVNNAHRLVMYIIEGKDQKLRDFAKQEGIAWASQSIALSFKLEWVQAIRRALWIVIEQYNSSSKEKEEGMEFFQVEKEINTRVDQFLNAFFISYSMFKDSLIKEQRELVENLSVPIIPINSSVSILPLIGSMDATRMETMEEKILTEVGNTHIQQLIIDFSGIADMGREEIASMKKIVDGMAMMGCDTVITGLRKEIARKIADSDMNFSGNTKTMGTLQQALNIYLVN